MTGVRTSLFAITGRKLYSQPFLNNRLRERRQVCNISRYEFELHGMVDGSESGVDPHETWRGNSTACGIPNGVYLRLEQPTATKGPSGLELVLFGTAIIGG